MKKCRTVTLKNVMIRPVQTSVSTGYCPLKPTSGMSATPTILPSACLRLLSNMTTSATMKAISMISWLPNSGLGGPPPGLPFPPPALLPI
jgi:hypothetical protein